MGKINTKIILNREKYIKFKQLKYAMICGSIFETKPNSLHSLSPTPSDVNTIIVF